MKCENHKGEIDVQTRDPQITAREQITRRGPWDVMGISVLIFKLILMVFNIAYFSLGTTILAAMSRYIFHSASLLVC